MAEGPGQQAPKPETRKRKSWDELSQPEKATGIVGVIALSAIGLWIIAAISSAVGHAVPTKTSVSHAASPTTTSSSPPATSSQPSVKQQIADWDSQYGSIFRTLSNDLSKFSTDAGAGDVAAAGADCQQLDVDIHTAQGQPPIPDGSVEQHWSSALSYYSAGAQDCVQGVQNNDANQITQASSEFDQANNEVTATSQAIDQAKAQ